MKYSTFILAISMLSLAFLSSGFQIDPNYNYDTFMSQFGRTYEGEEKLQHEKIFNEKYAQLLKLVEEGQDLVVNNMMDWNETQRSGKYFII